MIFLKLRLFLYKIPKADLTRISIAEKSYSSTLALANLRLEHAFNLWTLECASFLESDHDTASRIVGASSEDF